MVSCSKDMAGPGKCACMLVAGHMSTSLRSSVMAPPSSLCDHGFALLTLDWVFYHIPRSASPAIDSTPLPSSELESPHPPRCDPLCMVSEIPWLHSVWPRSLPFTDSFCGFAPWTQNKTVCPSEDYTDHGHLVCLVSKDAAEYERSQPLHLL